MKFSERIGIVKVKSIIQLNDISNELRNNLWNVYYTYYGSHLASLSYSSAGDNMETTFKDLWWYFWNQRIDDVPNHRHDMLNYTKKFFFNCKWWEVYEFLEVVISFDRLGNRGSFSKDLNIFLELCLSGFRLVDSKFLPITDDIELIEIQAVLDIDNSNKFVGCKAHIKKALELLALKPEGDYRNSIKESISSVESICKILSGEHGGELSKSLSILGSKIYIHKGLVSGFKSIYGFTSDEGGIRHSLLEESTLSQEDAIYMVVSCSAFINYLLSKAVKAGLV